MGYFLLYESMLDTVLYARDKWLNKGGYMFPDSCRLHICAATDESFIQEKYNFWDNVYGYKFESVKSSVFREPYVQCIPSERIFSNSYCILHLDLYKARKEDLDFSSPFKLQFYHEDACHALVCYFDVKFEACATPTGFSTAPFTPYTHWKQTMFYHDKIIKAQEGDLLSGSISVVKDVKHGRDLMIKLEIVDKEGNKQVKEYKMC